MLEGYTLDPSHAFIFRDIPDVDSVVRWRPMYSSLLNFGRFGYGQKINMTFPDESSFDVIRTLDGYEVIGEARIIQPEDIPKGTIAREYIPNQLLNG
jgi:hypothetical protein